MNTLKIFKLDERPPITSARTHQKVQRSRSEWSAGSPDHRKGKNGKHVFYAIEATGKTFPQKINVIF
jgi:hypothetical protein